MDIFHCRLASCVTSQGDTDLVERDAIAMEKSILREPPSHDS